MAASGLVAKRLQELDRGIEPVECDERLDAVRNRLENFERAPGRHARDPLERFPRGSRLAERELQEPKHPAILLFQGRPVDGLGALDPLRDPPARVFYLAPEGGQASAPLGKLRACAHVIRLLHCLCPCVVEVALGELPVTCSPLDVE